MSAASAEGGARRSLHVALGDRSYEIAIGPGLLGEAADRIRPHLPRGRTVIVTDETVGALYSAQLTEALERGGIAASEARLPPGEGSKSFAQLEQLVDTLLDAGVERSDCILALGGGVIGDLTGFASAILRRGCHFIQIPTTLLAQVDSSVGGKTGVNARQGKNLIGAFHQPRLVLIDIDVLNTLPPRHVKAGYAEIVKYALLGDAGFMDWLDANGGRLLAGEADALAHAIETSCAMKAAIVADDEREAGRRALLNLGHTFGHALEAAASFSDRLLHGEAVAVGCVLAFQFSARQGLCPEDDAARVAAHFAGRGLPSAIGDIEGVSASAAQLIAAMRQDKKATDGQLNLILARRIGEAFLAKDVDAGALTDFLNDKLKD
ncbi:MAG: 3-dehydroquinate synthase [Pseudomonadota bacterium]